MVQNNTMAAPTTPHPLFFMKIMEKCLKLSTVTVLLPRADYKWKSAFNIFKREFADLKVITCIDCYV